MENFPILREVPLGAAQKRVWGMIPSRRPATDIPTQQPGTVLVFDTGTRWVASRGRISGTEAFVVNAISVSVVQTRAQDVEVAIRIPSSSPADDFTVLSRFTCRVVNPELAAQHGPIDVVKILRNFLRKDRGLLTKGQETGIEDVRVLRPKMDARVRAFCDEADPRIPGMEVQLSSVEVLTPDGLRAHKSKMRDAVWARELAELLAGHEDADAKRLAGMFGQPEYVAALAVLRDKTDLGSLTVDVYADRRTKDSNILEFLKLLEKNGQLDRLPIDGRVLVNRLVERLTGTVPPDGADGAAITATAGASLPVDTETLTSLDATTRRTGDERFVVDDYTD